MIALGRTYPRIIGPAHCRLGGLTLSELHDQTGLPACFVEELLWNDFRPDVTWSAGLPSWQSSRQRLNILQPFETKAPANARANVCYWTSVQFYHSDPFENIELVEIVPRSWPRISFVERLGDLWEVGGGNIRYVAGKWRWRWKCWRNTELARHFRGICEDCVPCRQIEFVRRYGHGNYGDCVCGRAFALVPDEKLGPVLPRHRNSDILCGGSSTWPCRVIEPIEAKAIISRSL